MKPDYSNSLPLTCKLLFGACLLLTKQTFAVDAASTPPANIEHPVRETELTRVVLTPEAERRLGISTAKVERRRLVRTRLFGGEITLPARIDGGNPSSAPHGNHGGQSVYAILPSLSPAELVRLAQSQIDADGQVEQAAVQLQAARLALKRAEQMRLDKVGTERVVDDTRAQVGMAEAALYTARAQRELLGPALLDFANRTTLWVRIPVYVDDLPGLNTTAEARVSGLTNASSDSRPARPVAAPPSANPVAATIDLFYEVGNRDAALRPGQRVGVTIPLRDDDENPVVPWSAIVHDVDGGSWVYEALEHGAYARRRVQVLRVVGDRAALGAGLPAGTDIVTTGVAELFGTEFGAGK